MWAYIVRRLGEGIITLIVLSFVVFGSVFLTGDVTTFLIPISEDHDQKVYEEQKKAMGLDRPFIIQYLDFLGHALRLDFGKSFVLKQPIRDLLLERMPATVHLAMAGFLLSVVLGVPLGILSAVKRDSIFDRIAKAFAIFGMAAPQFWIAIMLILLFGAQFKLLPTFGRGEMEGWLPTLTQVPDMLHHLILPAFVLATSATAAIMRLARSAMLDVLDSDYIKFAQVKGLHDRVVIWKHAARNALIPVLTFAGITMAGLLNGAVVVEVVFAWPGVGLLLLQAVTSRDYPLAEGAILLSGAAYVSMAILVDILYGYADPRIRVN